MARTDYYDTDAKLLTSYGSGTPVVRRIIKRVDYTKINDEYVVKSIRATEIFEAQNAPKAGHPPPVYDFGRPDVLFAGGIEPLLIKGSTVLDIQTNRASVIADLVKAAQRTNKEQGAYIAFQYSTAKLFYLPYTPVSSSATHITLSVAPSGDVKLVPSDHTLQVIGTVHTHYAAVPPPKQDKGGTTTYSIHPGVSPQDQLSAKTDTLPVYAVDANYVHKALPNGQAKDKLSRSLDMLVDALETAGRM